MKNIYSLKTRELIKWFLPVLISSFFLTSASGQGVDTLNLKFFIEGYYQGGGYMTQVLSNEGIDTSSYPVEVDTVTIELHPPAQVAAIAYSYKGLLYYDGTMTCTFPACVTNHTYYIVIQHRNALETWSATPVTMLNTPVSYDFTTAQSQAYGSNMSDDYGEGIWSLYSGDITDSTEVPEARDGVIDVYDFILLFSDVQAGAGGYIESDLNGDGVVDINDFYVMYPNIVNGVTVMRPGNTTCAFTDTAYIDSAIVCYGRTTSVTVSETGGTGYIFGATSYTNVAAGTYIYTLTDAYGCTASHNLTVTQTSTLCPDTLKLKFFIEGYYESGGYMTRVLYNQGVDTNPYSGQVDTVTVQLRSPANVSTLVQSYKGMLYYDGTINCIFPATLTNHAYYIVVSYKNALETWSASPVTMQDTVSYDFTTAASKAYGSNMVDVYSEGLWSFYSGDVSDSTEALGEKDGVIDEYDFYAIYPDLLIGNGGYLISDINGDGGVDASDFLVMYPNIVNGVAVMRPGDYSCSLSVSAAADSIIKCYGGATTVTVTETGGVGSIFGTTHYTGVAAGVYTYTLTDAYNCSASHTDTVAQPVALTASITPVNVSCTGASNGSATVNVTGGTKPYIYSWAASGGTDSTAAGLAVGTYTVTVTDSNHCTIQDSITLTLDLHNSCSSAISIDAKSIYSDYHIGDTTLWFSFVADTSALAIKIADPLNAADTPNAQLQWAKLYTGACDTMILLGEWDAVSDSGSTQINVNYSSLYVDSAYFLELSRITAICAELSVTTDYLQKIPDCGSACYLVGDTNFSQYTSCANDSNPFNAGCVPCWTCSHGSPQMDTTGGNHAFMWAGDSYYNNHQGEGIQTPLFDTLQRNNAAIMYVFHVSFRQDSLLNSDSVPRSFTMHANLTTTGSANSGSHHFECDENAGGTPPNPLIKDTLMLVSDSTFNWISFTSCINPTATGLDILWIYPTTADSIVWVDVDSVQIYRIDADLGAPAITICDSATLRPIHCPPPYEDLTVTYQWYKNDTLITGASTDSLRIDTVSAPATYKLTITCMPNQGGSCSVSDTIRIYPVDSFAVSITPTPTVICSGNTKGTLFALPADSTFQYQWYRNDTLLMGATADTLAVTADQGWQTDSVVVSNGFCTAGAKKTFRVGPTPQIFSSHSAHCDSSDVATGTVMINTSSTGWQGPYKYQWYKKNLNDSIHGDTDSTAVIRPDTLYIVSVNDSSGCTSYDSILIGPHIMGPNISEPTCINNGTITLDVDSSTVPYSYLWNTDSTTYKATGLDTGTYTITVTDDSTECSVVITQKLMNLFNLDSIFSSPTTCLGLYTGWARVIAMNGDTPYTYIWSTGITITDTNRNVSRIDSLTAGTYKVIVTSGSTCKDSAFITVSQSDSLDLTPGHSTVCGGMAWVNVSDSSGSGHLHYLWTMGQDTIQDTIMYSSNDTISGFGNTVSPDTLTVTVTDTSSHCMASRTIIVSSYTLPALSVQPVDTTICSSQPVTLHATGASSYIWTPDTGLIDPDSANTVAMPLVTTTYIVTGTGSSHECTATAASTITVWPAIITPSLTQDTICNCLRLDTTSLGLGGTPPYTLQWYDTSHAITPVIPYDPLHANRLCDLTDTGNYNVSITDAHGCQIAVGITISTFNPNLLLPTITVTPANSAYCSGYGSGVILSASGSDGLTYLWSDSATTASIKVVTDSITTFTVTGSNSYGCTATASAIVVRNDTCCTNTGGEITYANDTLYNDSTYTGIARTLNSSVVISKNSTVTFNNLDLYIDDGITITIDSGATLVIDSSSHLQACHNMWHGIIVTSGGTLSISGTSIIEDAQYAVEAQDGSTIYINSGTFNDDYVGIYVAPDSTRNTVTSYINDCRFTCTANLKPKYLNQTPDPLTQTFAGIYVNDLNSMTLPGDAYSHSYYNYFDSLNFGIISINSNMTVNDGEFKNMQPFDAYNFIQGGIGIYARSFTGQFLHYAGNNAGTMWNNFDSCYFGIKVLGTSTSIVDASMSNMRTGIAAQFCKRVDIAGNRIAASFRGIGLNHNDAASENVIDNNTITMALTGTGASDGIFSNEFNGLNRKLSSFTRLLS